MGYPFFSLMFTVFKLVIGSLVALLVYLLVTLSQVMSYINRLKKQGVQFMPGVFAPVSDSMRIVKAMKEHPCTSYVHKALEDGFGENVRPKVAATCAFGKTIIIVNDVEMLQDLYVSQN